MPRVTSEQLAALTKAKDEVAQLQAIAQLAIAEANVAAARLNILVANTLKKIDAPSAWEIDEQTGEARPAVPAHVRPTLRQEIAMPIDTNGRVP